MITAYLQESMDLAQQLLADEQIAATSQKIVDASLVAFIAGNKILVAGNGGSAADAQHFAAEFVGKYKIVRSAYPAISLTTDTSAITAWGNDATFDGIFERQMQALGKKGDIFFGLSTSGNSKNILLALTTAKKMGIETVALLGGGGGKARGMAEMEIIIPSENTPRIQEMHMLILHSIAEEIEKRYHAVN
jgi:D-sedoheptulose 7-phosphate isomerase